MGNYTSLAEYQDLLKRVSLHGGRTLAFVGSGLSSPAGIPTWIELRDKIITDFVGEAGTRTSSEQSQILKQCAQAKGFTSLWNSFDLLKKIRGPAPFEQAIRRHLSVSEKANPPQNYERIWKMGAHGIITLNIDCFAQKSFAKLHQLEQPNVFNGQEVCNYADAMAREQPFICNLHGILANPSSWVFTSESRDSLLKTTGYKEFFSSCFLGASVIFVGITAEDTAAGGILANLVNGLGISFVGDHYWLTERSDSTAVEFSDKIGLKRIKYSSDENHRELEELLETLSKKNYSAPTPPVVVPPGHKARNYTAPTEAEVLTLGDPNAIRKALNQIASNILQKNTSDREAHYQNFVSEYDQAIHSSWYIPKKAKSAFFDYTIERLISSEGAFGAVYEARGTDNKSYAIKILHEAVRDNAEMQDAFRRGVSSMQILSKRKTKNVVNILGAWEMPAAIAMEFIDGYNLEMAVDSHCLDEWTDKLRVSSELSKILLRAHRLPEVVVHRDVRPPNVMLKDFQQKGDPIDITLIDFDLSWHKDAMGKSVQLTPSIHGYLAPEQYEFSNVNTSRSSLVDSFGLAMTIYFIVLGRHPKFEEPRRADWQSALHQNFRYTKCNRWLVIPCRMARLVYKGTLIDQSERIDMTSMVVELDNLLNLCENDKIANIRLFIEEVALRSEMLKDRYEWNEASGAASYNSATGLLIEVAMNSCDSIRMMAEWRNHGNGKFDTVKKYFHQKRESIASTIKASGWKVDIDVNYDGLKITCYRKINLNNISKNTIIQHALDLDHLMKSVNFSS